MSVAPKSALEVLDELADEQFCDNDAGFWILTSAAYHLNGHKDDDGSTVAHYFPEWAKEEGITR